MVFSSGNSQTGDFWQYWASWTDRLPQSLPGRTVGVIKKGTYADLLIVDGNQLKDIRGLEDYAKNMKVIMKDGVIYKNDL